MAVVKAVTPAVVNISTTRTVRVQGADISPFMDDPLFRQFFGEEFFKRFQMPRERRENSLGSGVIVSSDGYIVTNNHVIAKADEIKVLLNDKREFTGKVVGTDAKTDIAVIKISAKNLPVVPWGDSDKLDVGEYVLAVGNPLRSQPDRDPGHRQRRWARRCRHRRLRGLHPDRRRHLGFVLSLFFFFLGV